MGTGYLTPDSIPSDTGCRVFILPDDKSWWSILMGAVMPLLDEWNWQQFGSVTPAEAVEVFSTAFDLAYQTEQNECPKDCCEHPAPFWDSSTGSDAEDCDDDENENYGQIVEGVFVANAGLWQIDGFVATALVVGAAIIFFPIVAAFALEFLAGSAGAVAEVLVDGAVVGVIDTFAAAPAIIQFPVFLAAAAAAAAARPSMLSTLSSHELIIRLSEDNPHDLESPSLQVIRKRLYPGEVMPIMLRQNPDNSCLLEQSFDQGDTWTTAFDYSLCVPPAQQTILQTVINNNAWMSAFAPTETFISQTGYNDTQKEAAYQALCYAVGALVESLASTCLKAAQGEVTAETVTAVALGIAAAVLTIFDVVTFGALTPLCLAIAGAALAAIAAIEALSLDVWTDTDNLQALKCLALANLSNTPVSLANFQVAFLNAECLTDDQQAMAAVFSSMLANLASAQSLYDSFLNAMGNSNAASQSGILETSCACDTATWSYCLPMFAWFDRGAFYPTYIDVSGCTNPGYVPTHGGQKALYGGTTEAWLTQPITGVVNDMSRRFEFFIPSNATLTSLYAFFDRPEGNTDSVTKVVRIVGQSPSCVHVSGGLGEVGYGSLSISGQTVTVDVQFFNNNNQSPTYVYNIELTGTGVNPFAACDNC